MLAPFLAELATRCFQRFFTLHSSRSLPELSPSYFHGFLPHCSQLSPSYLRSFLSGMLARSSPQAICTVSFPSTMLSRSGALSTLFSHGFLFVYLRCMPAPSPQTSPEAISYGVLSVHASVLLPPRRSKLNKNSSIGDAFGKMIPARDPKQCAQLGF